MTQTSVDNVVAADIAANVAQTTNLSVAANVANLAVSTQIQSEVPQSADASISKPQIIQPTTQSRSITSYVVKDGDTVASVAAQFGVSTDTIKWANNLTADTLTPGSTLQVLPVDGVLYTVKDGDTVASIATKYNVDQSRLVLYNDLDLSGLTANSKIILPGAILPDTERPGYVAPRTTSYSSNVASGSVQYGQYSGAAVGNKYSYGYCTWYVYNRRSEMGMPIGSYWGNASSWAYAARSAGFLVDHTPSYGAIMQNGGGLGHVAVVENVAANGDVTVSEMNNGAYGGWGVKDTRTISAGQAAVYTFIH